MLLVRPGDDHTTLSLSSQPAVALMKRFLRSGELPTQRDAVKRRVEVYLPGMTRGAVEDPYAAPTGEEAGDVGTGDLTGDGILP